jgi:hypothetical protein
MMKMRMKSHVPMAFSLILLLSLTISCQKKKPEESSEAAIDTLAAIAENGEQEEDYTFHNEKLVAYKDFIDHLDAFKADNMQVAADKFKSTFKGADPVTCDSAYYIFEGYYSLTDDRLDEVHSNDSTSNYDSLVMENPGPLSKKLSDYRDKLKKNGFRVATTEGTTYIEKDRSFIKDNFYHYLTPVMVQYLDQIDKENEEGYWEDGGLVIGPTVLVDRIIWWEFFTKQNPGFIFKNLPNQKEQLYMASLITGEDNTPLYQDEATMELTGYFKEAYQYLFS